MFKRFLKYVIIGFLTVIIGSCIDSVDINKPSTDFRDVKIVGDQIILTTTFEIPEFRQAETRSFVEIPNLKDLKLYLVEFVDNGDPLVNTLSAVYRPTKEVAEEDNSKVIYTVTINKTNEPRILHLIAVADDNLDIPYGPEASIIPALTSAGLTTEGTTVRGEGEDAYWRRLEFPAGYCKRQADDTGKEVWVVNDDLQNKLINKNVKLIRNFAKVTVGLDETVSNFELEGFVIINTPLKGTVAPYSATNKLFPEFLDEYDQPLPYAEVAKNYSGVSPANTLLGSQATSEDAPEIPIVEDLTDIETVETSESGTTVKTWKCLPSQYMYERPFRNLNHTYIIVRGKFHSPTTEWKSTYYKLDLGRNDSNGIFRYYGILRNFNYFIRITQVDTDGYDTPAAAATGTVYNNISFDIDTDQLMNMSNGKDIVRVNLTTAVITDNDSILEFRYAYKHDIWESNNGTYNNDRARFIGLEPGAVIKSVNPSNPNLAPDINDVQNTPWRTVTIACNNPTSVTQTQEFTVVNSKTGLGRTISLVSHLKWDFENVREFARIWENYPSTYSGLTTENTPTSLNNSTYANLCGTDVGSQFTIFFDIPDNIPEVLFPLVFTIESNLQGLENEPMGTIVVSPGPSLFPDNKGENRIQYNKSVTWSEYNSPLRMDTRDDNGTLLETAGDGPNIHRVRCRFRTIEQVDNSTEVTVMIANINFNNTEVKFTRTDAANNLTGPGLVITN
ncbi:MAG: hypothetical protein K2H60_01040 [Muribaculaceae bacterium]|nr:hypothetical protein [Muribaculaceae bacterium]